MHDPRPQAETPSPERLAADKTLQDAVLAYSRDQSAANRAVVRRAVWNLDKFLFWPEGQQQSPARLRMWELMPQHLHWPDPMWGETLFG